MLGSPSSCFLSDAAGSFSPSGFINAFLKSKVLLVPIAHPPTPFPPGRGKTEKLGSAGAKRLQNPISPITPPRQGRGWGWGRRGVDFKKTQLLVGGMDQMGGLAR